MKITPNYFVLFLLAMLSIQCKKEVETPTLILAKNTIQYAKGFTLTNYEGYSVIRVIQPWPKANKDFTYILKKDNGVIPDSLLQNPIISIPIQKIVVTSTTHIPSLEMLDVEQTLIGFPNLDYISSDKVRARIEAKKIKELGANQSLNTEVLIDLQPDVIIGFGIDNNNPTLDNLQKSGLKVLLNGDWNEETPLGKAEWIKFFGALYDKQELADELFSKIEKDYLKNGYFAMNQSEEIYCKGLTVTFIKRIEDVTAKVSENIGVNFSDQQKWTNQQVQLGVGLKF